MPHNRPDIEQTLRRSEERVRLIIDSSLDAVVTIDEQGLITGWNPQAEAIFGWPRDEALHHPLADLIIPQAHREAHRKGLQHFMNTGEGPVLNRRMELSALRKSGETFPIELTISPLQIGDHYEFSAFVRDITEPKRLEAELRRANEELEQRVRERTAQLAAQAEALRRANEALERSNLELKQFAYIASHDLQSPLRNISGFVQLLRSEYEGRLGERADDWIRRTVQSIQLMQALSATCSPIRVSTRSSGRCSRSRWAMSTTMRSRCSRPRSATPAPTSLATSCRPSSATAPNWSNCYKT